MNVKISRSLFLGLFFLTTLSLISCGKNGESTTATESADDSADDYDPAAGLSDVKKTIASIPTEGDPDKESAVEEGQVTIDDLIRVYGMVNSLGSGGSSRIAEYIRLLKAAQERSLAISTRFINVGFGRWAVVYQQLANQKPVFRVTDKTPGRVRFYYTSDPNQLARWAERFKETYRFGGVAFNVWTSAEPVNVDGFPKIPVKPLYGCQRIAGGTWVNNEQSCTGVNTNAPTETIGWASNTGDSMSLPIHRMRHKTDGAKILATIRKDEQTNPNYNFIKVLGESAFVRFLAPLPTY